MDKEDYEEEELEDVPPHEQRADPLYRARISHEVHGQIVQGQVQAIHIGTTSQVRLYFIHYADGYAEHLSSSQVIKCSERSNPR